MTPQRERPPDGGAAVPQDLGEEVLDTNNTTEVRHWADRIRPHLAHAVESIVAAGLAALTQHETVIEEGLAKLAKVAPEVDLDTWTAAVVAMAERGLSAHDAFAEARGPVTT